MGEREAQQEGEREGADRISQGARGGAVKPLSACRLAGPPPAVDLAAYRIVQEALTNVLRHAGPATATVRLTYDEDHLTVQVDDDGHGAAAA